MCNLLETLLKNTIHNIFMTEISEKEYTFFFTYK